MKTLSAHLSLVLLASIIDITAASASVMSPWSVYLQNSPGGTQQPVETCNAEPGMPCFGGLPTDGTTPFASNSLSSTDTLGTYTSESYADLRSGKIGIKGDAPLYQNGAATAQFIDTLYFNGIALGQSISIDINIQLNGTFIDGSQLNFYYGANSGIESLTTGMIYGGTFTGSGSEPILPGATTYNFANAPKAINYINTGNWTQSGPSTFSGSIHVFSDNPMLQLTMTLTGSGAYDASHTASISLAPLPQGVSFTSASGVFLSEVSNSVPEPTSLALLILGLTGFSIHRWRKA